MFADVLNFVFVLVLLREITKFKLGIIVHSRFYSHQTKNKYAYE